jgi:hypothetical protein
MNGELIGYADLNINGTGYDLYEVYRDHTQKCIVIRQVAQMEDFFLPHFGYELPRYDAKIEAHRQDAINASKNRKAPLRSPIRRTYGNSTGRTSRNLTTASRPDLSHIEDAPRRMADRKPSKQMSQAEVKRLLADALGMEVEE